MLGDEHPKTLMAINNMGTLLNAQVRYAEAEQLVRESLPIHIRILGENHWRSAEARSLLGAALAGLERYQEAETYLLDAQADLDASVPGGRRTQKLPPSIERLVRLYDAWGKPQLAAEWRAKLPVEQETVASDQALPANDKQDE